MPGDFASENPARQLIPPFGIAGGISTANAFGTDQFLANATGVDIGLFVWIQADGTIDNVGISTNAPDGFVPRTQQGLILTQPTGVTPSTDTWYGVSIPGGQPVTVFESGSFYVRATVAGATYGQKAFAKSTDGSIQFAAAGATVTGFVETSWVCRATVAVGEITIISAA